MPGNQQPVAEHSVDPRAHLEEFIELAACLRDARRRSEEVHA
jgi:hypothetical protein